MFGDATADGEICMLQVKDSGHGWGSEWATSEYGLLAFEMTTEAERSPSPPCPFSPEAENWLIFPQIGHKTFNSSPF